jgi:hypothetical protein
LKKWGAKIFAVFKSFVYQIAANWVFRDWQEKWTKSSLEELTKIIACRALEENRICHSVGGTMDQCKRSVNPILQVKSSPAMIF